MVELLYKQIFDSSARPNGLKEILEVISEAFQFSPVDTSRINSVTFELMHALTMNYDSSEMRLSVDSGVRSDLQFMIDCWVGSLDDQLYSKLKKWANLFRARCSFQELRKGFRVQITLDGLHAKSLLDPVSIDLLRDQLRNIELKGLESKSREELIQDIRDRSSKLHDLTNYLTELEKKGAEIENLNLVLSEKNMELEASMEQVRLADRMKSQFLANMSHELRTPLNSVIGFSQLMQDGLVGELTEEQLEIVTDILNSGNHLLNLINQILDISKIEAGMMELHKETLEVDKVISVVMADIRPLAEAKKLKLVEKTRGLKVHADQTRIRQVLLNLLSNAIKFSPEDSEIVVSTRAHNGSVEFSVKDHGIGIRPEDQKSIFEEFKQVDDSHTREYQGTGLGLSLVKKLVNLHGGRVWVQSEVGKGSEFFFSIPMED